MADTVKSANTLQFSYTLSDGSSDVLLLDNAKASIAAADIDSLASFIASNELLLKNGATFAAITEARSISREKTILDLS